MEYVKVREKREEISKAEVASKAKKKKKKKEQVTPNLRKVFRNKGVLNCVKDARKQSGH